MTRETPGMHYQDSPLHYLWRPFTERSVELVRPVLERLAEYLVYEAGITDEDKIMIALPERLGRTVLGISYMIDALQQNRLSYSDSQVIAEQVRAQIATANDTLPGLTLTPYRSHGSNRSHYYLPTSSPSASQERAEVFARMQALTGAASIAAVEQDNLTPLLRVGQRLSHVPQFDRESVLARLQEGLPPNQSIAYGPLEVVPVVPDTNPFTDLSTLL